MTIVPQRWSPDCAARFLKNGYRSGYRAGYRRCRAGPRSRPFGPRPPHGGWRPGVQGRKTLARIARWYYDRPARGSIDSRMAAKLRILVVAEDAALRATLARWLTTAGYAVELAEGPKRAREVVAA